MKSSDSLISTVKEAPNDAQIISHQLMIRAGLISKLASGIYSYLPLGLKVVQKVEKIIREEMNKSKALELLMPVAQPAEIWQESKRWEEYGPELLRFKDRHDRDFCLGPTHEEVITNIAKQYLRSYKQLPINFYQIQTKFRDEIRPRFGVMRSREFIMKDAYSFHIDEKSLGETYQIMHQTYCNIFDRIGFNYRAVLADSGAIGGESSHEFHVLADSGEDAICFSDESDYAANIERAETLPQGKPKPAKQTLELVKTPGVKTINDVCNLLKIKPTNSIKTLIVEGDDDNLVALVLRGDHELNEVKASKIQGLKQPLQMAEEEKVQQRLGCSFGSIGVVNLDIPIIADYAAAFLSDFVCGANENDKHFVGVNWNRDTSKVTSSDLRNIVTGDPSPDGKGKLEIKRGIEVGHIFQLGTKYSDSMNANVIGEDGRAVNMNMGCYGIGVTRIVAASIEQNHDDKGIIFPEAIAPFHLVIVPINYNKSSRVKALADELYNDCLEQGIEVLLDDRKERAGVMFADSELLGIPHRLVISDTHADNGKIEYKSRKESDKVEVDFKVAVNFILEKLA
ncbi:MAG: proline--tRNA ligase [Candidatus Pseudothioglobus sp.]|jgi:prolyl-tRNA synthetase|nr:proline--tRNA ligase [Candidatus Thioglobus sp.]HIL45068.1 proline--tRNA ligase [Candidatus Thioglobus sp.]